MPPRQQKRLSPAGLGKVLIWFRVLVKGNVGHPTSTDVLRIIAQHYCTCFVCPKLTGQLADKPTCGKSSWTEQLVDSVITHSHGIPQICDFAVPFDVTSFFLRFLWVLQ